MADVDPAAIVTKWMLKLANEIANQADATADEWKDYPGDVALRAFAQAIRATNGRAGFIPDSAIQ